MKGKRQINYKNYKQLQIKKKREIFLLKPAYLESFVNDFRRQNLYKKDANFISQRLKKTG